LVRTKMNASGVSHSRRSAILRVPLGILLGSCLAACGPSEKDGDVRQVKIENRAKIITVKGAERFVDGEWQKFGPFFFYDDHGDVIASGSYKDGLESGPWNETYGDRCTGRGIYLEGFRSGPWQTFHAKGMPQDSGDYELGLRTGLWLSYRRNGTKLREAQYKEGQENGRVVYFGPEGRIVNHELSGTFEDGERKKPLEVPSATRIHRLCREADSLTRHGCESTGFPVSDFQGKVIRAFLDDHKADAKPLV